MSNFMNSIKVAKLNSNFFDLSHDVKTSLQMGWLVPSPAIDCVPGDKIKLGAKSIVRFAPLVAPVMHRFDVRHEYFFVPKRLLWSNWDNYLTQTPVGGEIPAFPYITIDQETARPDNYRLLNYLGVPFRTGVSQTKNINAMIPAAYQLIYNEFFRAGNIIDEDADSFTLQDGDNTANLAAICTLRLRAWERDYMTSNLPEAQKGDPVMIPIGSQRVVLDPASTDPALLQTAALPHSAYVNANLETSASSELQGDAGGIDAPLQLDPNGTLITEDGGEATAINDLRLAYAIQRVKEKLMRGGSRLTEFLRVFFGVTPQDARLQRPEYITGVKAPLVISEVLNTTGTEELPQGNMAGHGVGLVSDGYNKSYYVQEHGYIICITSVLPRTAYQQGLDRMWSKISDPTDEYTPDLASIGEQATLNQEVFAWQGANVDIEEFGYNPRYAEYKTMRSYVTGEFQTSLQHWHDARIFGSPPVLDQFFIEATPDPRIFAVQDGADHCYCHIYHEIKAVRKMPKFGTPTY